MSENDQNRQINALKREVQRLSERLRTLELDIEPEGRISEGFERLSQDIDTLRDEIKTLRDETHRRFDTLTHSMNTLLARQEVMLEMITRIGDLPEE